MANADQPFRRRLDLGWVTVNEKSSTIFDFGADGVRWIAA
jgi:hypothetical protein